jgi:CMP-N-acetylneuraminic acid synthetase
MKIAGMLVVRKNSVRVPNKLLRPFGGTTLFDIALERYSRHPALSRLYLCAHEDEFFEKAAAYPDLVQIRRSHRSAHGETAAEIYDFLDQVEEEWLVNLNPCCPFARAETLTTAIGHFATNGCKSLVPAVTIRDWVCNEQGQYLNAAPDSINSKDLRPLYKMTHPFVIYSKTRLRDTGTIWSLSPGDPCLFPVGDFEGIDIDMPNDFTIAEALYRYLNDHERAVDPCDHRKL